VITNLADVLQEVIIGKEVEVIAPTEWEGLDVMYLMNLTGVVGEDQGGKATMLMDLVDQEGTALTRAVVVNSMTVL